MINILSIKDFWKERDKHVLVDVRTPAEYEKGHIPGALNLSLFSNEERAIVGKTFKQESPEKALLQGLDLVGSKLSDFVKQAKLLAKGKSVVVHCWRGGKRSSSMAWLLDLAGFDIKVLEGGYKAYKNYIRNEIQANSFNFIVLGGKTGSGKTHILKALESKGEQVVDLEKLAHHKGSAFGWLGESKQPNSDQFENDLFEQLMDLDLSKRVWIENESRNIGSVYLPDVFWPKMKDSPVINIEIPFHDRVQILVDEYAQFPKEQLLISFKKIKKRLGGQNLKAAETALAENNFHEAAEIALKYYDKSYQFLLENNNAPKIHMLEFDKFEPTKNADSLIAYCNTISKKYSNINA